MESRTLLAIGGMTTVAASIAVVCAVSMTTSAALVDSAGAAIAARPVVVPASAASPTPGAAPTAVPAAPLPVESSNVEAETVPAPEPEIIAGPRGTQITAGEPSAETEDRLAADVAASGSWDVVYAWADEHGWSPASTQAWIARLDAKIADDRGNPAPGRSATREPGQQADEGAERLVNDDADKLTDEGTERLVSEDAGRLTDEGAERLVDEAAPEPVDEETDRVVAPDSITGDRIGPAVPAPAHKASERDHSGPAFGSKRERSQVPPD